MRADYVRQLSLTRALRPRTGRALVECAAQLIWLSAGASLSLASGWTWALGQLLLGFGAWRAFAMLHAAGHRALFRSALANDLAGLALSPFCALPYFAWKHVHAEHHRWTGWVDRDPTMRAIARGGLPPVLGGLLDLCWRLWIPVVSVAFIAGTFFVPGRDGRPGARRRLLELGSIAVVSMTHGVALWLWPEAWLHVVGLSTFVYLTLGDLSLLAQHVALPMERAGDRVVRPRPLDEQARFSRTMLLPRWFERGVALGFNAHAFHHLFPHVPYYAHPEDVAFGEVNGWRSFIGKAKAQRATTLLYGAPTPLPSPEAAP